MMKIKELSILEKLSSNQLDQVVGVGLGNNRVLPNGKVPQGKALGLRKRGDIGEGEAVNQTLDELPQSLLPPAEGEAA